MTEVISASAREECGKFLRETRLLSTNTEAIMLTSPRLAFTNHDIDRLFHVLDRYPVSPRYRRSIAKTQLLHYGTACEHADNLGSRESIDGH